jgi:Asp-tRNA(Asn)/Glu-tRNA(Gln) amidotransferase A subunit family amidase
MTEPRDLTLYGAAELLRRGRLTSEALVRSCLERIERREAVLHAWAELHPEHALAEARACDEEARLHRWRGPLHGLPLGIKDVIHVRGMHTQAGTSAYPTHLAEADAASVAALRESGAIVLGKTVTTAFAYRDPSPARNPWDPTRSPGGSSAGSAVAVADGMCLGALGTQTGGSTLRPASYTGIVGFKSGLGKISTEGLVPVSWQLDHVGIMTRDVQDAALLWNLLRQDRPLDWQSTRDKLPPALLPHAPKRVWRMREVFEQQADPAMLETLAAVCRVLAEGGVTVVERALPAEFEGVPASHATIMGAEAATWHQGRYLADPAAYPEGVSELVREGLEIRGVEYIRAQRHRAAFIRAMRAAFADVDCAIMPSAPGPAPAPDTTGSARFNSPWSLCGFPSLSLPAGLSGGELPLGVQLVGGPEGEDDLLAAAGWVERLLEFDRRPA